MATEVRVRWSTTWSPLKAQETASTVAPMPRLKLSLERTEPDEPVGELGVAMLAGAWREGCVRDCGVLK